jgi:MOSC domain-containing protein YiiM/ferredoxin
MATGKGTWLGTVASTGPSSSIRLTPNHYWQSQLGRNDFTYGQFGENFTVDGLSDQEVCIGDRYRIGSALFEVTQPRVTCYRVGIRMNESQMAALLVAHGRPGFYFRVLEEGEVEAGDEIVQVAAAFERMTISEINALLYMPGHPRSQVERALRIPALSDGWRASFQALLEQEESGGAPTGNAGLAPASGPPPAWSGFRPLRVSRKVRESSNVISLVLEPIDGQPLTAALPGQSVVLRLRQAPEVPALLRCYSLSGEPSAERYRVSIKREAHSAAGAYIDDKLQIGDGLDVSAARGSFTLRPGGDAPVVFLSAGIGATAMLHVLAARVAIRSPQPPRAPFCRGDACPPESFGPRRNIRYSSPDPEDRPGLDFDARGRLDMRVLQELGVPRNADFYILYMRTARLHERSDRWPRGLGHRCKPHPHRDFRCRSVHYPRRRRVAASATAPTGWASRHRTAGLVRPELCQRSLGAAFQTLLELAEACDVPVRWSCRTGVCHTCETGLFVGAVSYRPDPVDAPAEGYVLICCSQPRGDIVVDL